MSRDIEIINLSLREALISIANANGRVKITPHNRSALTFVNKLSQKELDGGTQPATVLSKLIHQQC